ncbi:unnamed protein product [Protopolystoma xenopodis]|uniref:Uncharacterized protein n=1 Tax=Protopolystoma xenopodis TaxID=117903 RepID=A0A448WX55_9PLAT|nr:unnamed protein product [Protopolystoma xenopodis]
MKRGYFAQFSLFSADLRRRAGSPDLVDLAEGQSIDPIDVDNPDRWVVRTRAPLKSISSIESEEEPMPVTPTSGQDIAAADEAEVFSLPEQTRVGRCNAVCVARHRYGEGQKLKRDPREQFREEVITITNKLQEASMKRRYLFISPTASLTLLYAFMLLVVKSPSRLPKYVTHYYINKWTRGEI